MKNQNTSEVHLLHNDHVLIILFNIAVNHGSNTNFGHKAKVDEVLALIRDDLPIATFPLICRPVSVLVANTASVKRTLPIRPQATLVFNVEGWLGLIAVSGPLQWFWLPVYPRTTLSGSLWGDLLFGLTKMAETVWIVGMAEVVGLVRMAEMMGLEGAAA